ncbi:uncharacterized protein LOC130934768 [Arachis stenosperma]|uniref:uncharacterized protein LOC130934768 n=1 Tax=Arachis stenosperma TaxID=217475 RepID=UPI0025AC4FA9|nr:uncharacterized protein LOC130934768 [Arachis stenosperma]
MCQLLGCKEESLPVRYLGISLGVNLRFVKTWKLVIDKVEDKLSLWKAKTLNKVGNGRTVRFWEDIWLPHGVLKELFPRLFSISNLKGSVIGDCGFWDGLEWIWNFQWRRELFQWELALVNQLHQEAILLEEITSYSFTSAIWKGFVPPRIELFSWFVLVGRVNTKDKLRRLGVINPNDRTCVLCGKSVESAFHLFVGCEISWQVWCAWLFALRRKRIMPGTLKQHFESWTNAAARRGERRRWVIGFFAVIWTVWLERNDRIFRNQSSRVVDIISKSFLLSDEWSGGEPYGC